MRAIKTLANNSDKDSMASRMRRQRFALFLELLERIPPPITVLDVGGTERFWEVMGFTNNPDCHITLLNLSKPHVKYNNFTGVAGDATDLTPFKDNQFDIVFSNSVIEHVGDYDQQGSMAKEVQRVGARHFVQTPNYFFPLEPHFLFFGFQWLPFSVRVALIRRFNLGWMRKMPDINEAEELIHSIQLLRKKDFQALFPKSNLYEEKLFGLTKSFVVYSD